MMKNTNDKLTIPLLISVAAHLLFAGLFFLVPSLFSKKLPEEQVFAIEMLPVSDTSNIKTQKKQTEKAIESEESKKVLKSKAETKEAEAPKPLEQKKEDIKKDTPTTKEVTPDTLQKKDDKIKEPQKIEKKDDKKEDKKEKDTKKPIEKDTKKPPKKKEKKEVELDSLLKTLEQASEGKNNKSKKHNRSPQTNDQSDAQGPFDNLSPLSISEFHAIRQQIERHWNIPIGAQNSENIKIVLYIRLKIDGTVEHVELISKNCPSGSAVLCEAAADGALRAVWLASPLQNLTQERYDSWKELNIEFDPSEISG